MKASSTLFRVSFFFHPPRAFRLIRFLSSRALWRGTHKTGLLRGEHEGLQALRRQGDDQGQPSLHLHGAVQGEGLPGGRGPAQAGRRELPRSGVTCVFVQRVLVCCVRMK